MSSIPSTPSPLSVQSPVQYNNNVQNLQHKFNEAQTITCDSAITSIIKEQAKNAVKKIKGEGEEGEEEDRIEETKVHDTFKLLCNNILVKYQLLVLTPKNKEGDEEYQSFVIQVRETDEGFEFNKYQYDNNIGDEYDNNIGDEAIKITELVGPSLNSWIDREDFKKTYVELLSTEIKFSSSCAFIGGNDGKIVQYKHVESTDSSDTAACSTTTPEGEAEIENLEKRIVGYINEIENLEKRIVELTNVVGDLNCDETSAAREEVEKLLAELVAQKQELETEHTQDLEKLTEELRKCKEELRKCKEEQELAAREKKQAEEQAKEQTEAALKKQLEAEAALKKQLTTVQEELARQKAQAALQEIERESAKLAQEHEQQQQLMSQQLQQEQQHVVNVEEYNQKLEKQQQQHAARVQETEQHHSTTLQEQHEQHVKAVQEKEDDCTKKLQQQREQHEQNLLEKDQKFKSNLEEYITKLNVQEVEHTQSMQEKEKELQTKVEEYNNKLKVQEEEIEEMLEKLSSAEKKKPKKGFMLAHQTQIDNMRKSGSELFGNRPPNPFPNSPQKLIRYFPKFFQTTAAQLRRKNNKSEKRKNFRGGSQKTQRKRNSTGGKLRSKTLKK